jgi:hypothetical protein
VVVLAGLQGEAEIARAAALAPLPVIAFDGVQGAALGAASWSQRRCPKELATAPPCSPRSGTPAASTNTETPSTQPYGYGEPTTAGNSERTKPSSTPPQQPGS